MKQPPSWSRAAIFTTAAELHVTAAARLPAVSADVASCARAVAARQRELSNAHATPAEVADPVAVNPRVLVLEVDDDLVLGVGVATPGLGKQTARDLHRDGLAHQLVAERYFGHGFGHDTSHPSRCSRG